MHWKELFRTKPITQLIHSDRADISGTPSLKRRLGVVDLTAMGVAAVLGSGVFSTIGNAAADGGPGVVLLFIFTAVACGFSAICYADFASRLPVAGSAYTYAYASFGEFIAWIIGWNLIMSYAIGNSACAISWSQYFTGLLGQHSIIIPKFLTMDFVSASQAYDQVISHLAHGQTLAELAANGSTAALLKGYAAWSEAPRIFGHPIVFDLPSLLIIILITGIVYIGIEESRLVSNFLVFLKVIVVLTVIAVGAVYVDPTLWVPFAPHGLTGILKGTSAVFFAYIGFDAVSTAAEECKNPQRDLPRSMIYSLIICTTLYALVALVLTGIVKYDRLGVGDPLAFVFGPNGVHIPWLAGIIDITAIVALSTVILVFQLGLPRIMMTMSRDGLIPPLFASIHHKHRTPWFSTLFTGLFVAAPALFMNLAEVTDLTSIGTLFAFILVCGGILKLDATHPTSKDQSTGSDVDSNDQRKFKTPYINSKYIFPVLMIASLILAGILAPNQVIQFFTWGSWDVLTHKIPMVVFSVEMLILGYYCFTRNLSLIPVLGVATCSYLITELGITNWVRFGMWLMVGVGVYFLYGMKNSRLNLRWSSPPLAKEPVAVHHTVVDP